jgi:hypothetical protein
MDRIYSSEQIVVPATLPAILKAYSKEVIRFQPEDVVAFSRDYFNALANGEEQQFLGQLERAKGNSATAKVTAKAEAAKADPVYNGVDDVQDTYTAAEEETKQADYAASANDAALVEFITSESFIEFSNAVFDISQQDQDDEKMVSSICQSYI